MSDVTGLDKNRQCIKCRYSSGNGWDQCGKSCPVSISPHYDPVKYPPKEPKND